MSSNSNKHSNKHCQHLISSDVVVAQDGFITNKSEGNSAHRRRSKGRTWDKLRRRRTRNSKKKNFREKDNLL